HLPVSDLLQAHHGEGCLACPGRAGNHGPPPGRQRGSQPRELFAAADQRPPGLKHLLPSPFHPSWARPERRHGLLGCVPAAPLPGVDVCGPPHSGPREEAAILGWRCRLGLIAFRRWPYLRAAMPKCLTWRCGVPVRETCISHGALQADCAPECGPDQDGDDGDEYKHDSSSAIALVLRRETTGATSSGIIFWLGIHSQLERFTVDAYPSADLSGRSQEKPDSLGPLMRRPVTHTQVHPAGAR